MTTRTYSQAQLDAAVAKEREAIAQLVEQHDPDREAYVLRGPMAFLIERDRIASKIRARGPKATPHRRVDAYTMGDELGLRRLEDMTPTAAHAPPSNTATETRSDASPFEELTNQDLRAMHSGYTALLAERDALQAKYTAWRIPLLAERDALLEKNARLKQACDIFEKNSADAIELEKERDAAQAEVARLTTAFDNLNRGVAIAQVALMERNAGLAAALREAKKLGTHRIAAGDDYACDVADIADEALEKFTGEKP